MVDLIEEGFVHALLDSLAEGNSLSRFLDKLRTASGATYASIVFKPAGLGNVGSIEIFSGEASSPDLRRLYFEKLHSIDPLPYENLEADVVYSEEDLLIKGRAAHDTFYKDFLVPCGMATMLMMRLAVEPNISAWLIISSPGDSLDEIVRQRLMALAPLLKRVLLVALDRERHRFAMQAAGNALQRLSFGWISLDRDGQVVEADAFGAKLLEMSSVVRLGRHGRLALTNVSVDKVLTQAIAQAGSQDGSRPWAIRASQDPWIELLVLPYDGTGLALALPARVIVYVHSDTVPSRHREEQIVDLFKLLPSEARLALVLAKGVSIAEAAEQLGLSVETARTYSKKIYSKVGARGQAELIWIMMTSILAIS